ncbi:MAG: hypothetical protein ACQEP2_07430 [Actinomycetota bacterium]
MPIEDEEDVDFAEVVESISLSIEADSDLSGYIIKDTETRAGIVMVGDWDNNKQIKGYLTFDLSYFEDISSIELRNAVLRYTHINKAGNPENFSSVVDFKEYNYGSSLDPVDFAVGGRRIFTVNISEFLSPLEVSSTTLIEALETIINTGHPDFQIKIGLNSTTNNDSIGDFYQFHPSSVFLDLEFLSEE